MDVHAAPGHDKGVNAVSMVGQRDFAVVKDFERGEDVALVRGHGEGHGIALHTGRWRDSDAAVSGLVHNLDVQQINARGPGKDHVDFSVLIRDAGSAFHPEKILRESLQGVALLGPQVDRSGENKSLPKSRAGIGEPAEKGRILVVFRNGKIGTFPSHRQTHGDVPDGDGL